MVLKSIFSVNYSTYERTASIFLKIQSLHSFVKTGNLEQFEKPHKMLYISLNSMLSKSISNTEHLQ